MFHLTLKNPPSGELMTLVFTREVKDVCHNNGSGED
jgi:hypothetical protein